VIRKNGNRLSEKIVRNQRVEIIMGLFVGRIATKSLAILSPKDARDVPFEPDRLPTGD
jgi:hypothetical protein